MRSRKLESQVSAREGPRAARRSGPRRNGTTEAVASARSTSTAWRMWVALGAALVAVFWAYSPALNAPFLFDDSTLPGFHEPLRAWVSGVRPALMFTYWLNAQLSGEYSFSFHVVNVVFHFVTSGLVYLIAVRLLEWSGTEPVRSRLLGAFAGIVYLLHPLQSETVAYVSGRSEGQSVLFAFLAFTLFLYRRQRAVSWKLVAVLFGLFGIALLSKEQVIVLPGLLLLADYWWNPGFSFRGIKNNWRLYLPLAAGAALAVAFFWRILVTSQSAGFHLKDVTWYQYFFTQCRALFVYIGLFLAPFHLTADWDFPVSRTLFDRGAIFGLAALLALAVLAWVYRKRFPLASFGYFAYLLLMSPTSSILPIQDAVAERRAYFSMLGLLLIVLEFARRLKVERRVIVAACLFAGVVSAAVTYSRAQVWSGPISLWEDTVVKSPAKPRAHFQLGFAYFERGEYGRAVEQFGQTGKVDPVTRYNLLIDWALSLDALGRTNEALAKLREAASVDRTAHVYSQIGMIYARHSEWPKAMQALAEAENIDPNYFATYLYRGKIHLKLNQPELAVADYSRALSLNPQSAEALQELKLAQSAARQQERR